MQPQPIGRLERHVLGSLEGARRVRNILRQREVDHAPLQYPDERQRNRDCASEEHHDRQHSHPQHPTPSQQRERRVSGSCAARSMHVTRSQTGRAELVVWLCTDAASFITGAALPVDGGSTAR